MDHTDSDDQSAIDGFSVSIDDSGTIVVVGDIDMASGPLLNAAIVAHEVGHRIVLDLGGVSFIDSSGLRSLLAASRRASLGESMVSLRSVGPEVTRLLEITGTASLFSLDDADE